MSQQLNHQSNRLLFQVDNLRVNPLLSQALNRPVIRARSPQCNHLIVHQISLQFSLVVNLHFTRVVHQVSLHGSRMVTLLVNRLAVLAGNHQLSQAFVHRSSLLLSPLGSQRFNRLNDRHYNLPDSLALSPLYNHL